MQSAHIIKMRKGREREREIHHYTKGLHEKRDTKRWTPKPSVSLHKSEQLIKILRI